MDRLPESINPWSQPAEQLLERHGVTVDQGLNASAVEARRRSYGLNQLRTKRRESSWRVLANQFKSLIVLLLVVAAVVSVLYDERLDAIAILAVVVINAAIGFVTELRAVRSMEALAKLSRTRARVRREGTIQEIAAQELVPGDIVIVEAGDVVSADIRLVQASKLQANESTLTGESLPVGKRREPAAEDAPLAERFSMLFKGTTITRGSGEGVVVATGMATQIGEISALVEESELGEAPLEARLDRLGRGLIWATAGIASLVSIAGVIAGRDILTMLKTGVALAVAAIPEGLPIVATMTLAQGMWHLARHNALIRRLSAVETLGATSVIFTDKTGTLTENRMTVTKLWLPSGMVEIGGEALPCAPDVREALELGALCNNAALGESDSGTEGASGDPVEIALLAVAAKAGLYRADIEGSSEEFEEPFDPETKMMATYHKTDSHYRVAVKGAPESVLEHCRLTGEERTLWLQRNREMSEQGLRVLALATKTCSSTSEPPYRELVFSGLVGMHDPPSEGVERILESFRGAGVRVIMVTGDQAGTAASIARAIGMLKSGTNGVLEGRHLQIDGETNPQLHQSIAHASVFARVSPKQKLDLIRIYQENGAVVAMTGDGVNDAPALKKADIGIAMGKRGTEVAREAADMVLSDDSLQTIVVAIEQGRVIFGNIRKFVVYLLSCNLSEILTVGLFAMTSLPMPILPIQILFLNLLTDVFPALALGLGKGDPAIMRSPPRPAGEPIVTRANWLCVSGNGLLLSGAVIGAFLIALLVLELEIQVAVTISFLTLALAQLLHVFNMTGPDSGLFRNEVTENPFVWGALALCIGMLLLVLYQPMFAEVLRLSAPDALGWSVVAGMAFLPLLVLQTIRAFRRFVF